MKAIIHFEGESSQGRIQQHVLYTYYKNEVRFNWRDYDVSGVLVSCRVVSDRVIHSMSSNTFTRNVCTYHTSSSSF